MSLRVAFILGVLLQSSGLSAQGFGMPVDQRIHESGICWEPDIEFPVPCDDDDD
jgi:hypothetical protein